MDLSIIILSYNNSALLKACVDSVCQSVKDISFEVIVVDNGSTDDSVQMVRNSYPSAKVIETGTNLGYTKANNRGIALSSGKYVCLLNNDTVVKEKAFDKLVSFMQSTPEAGACGPKLLNADGTPQRQGSVIGSRFWNRVKAQEVSFVTGACLVLKKDAIEKIGALDENLFFYNDDLDICRRIRNAGLKIFFLPDAEVVHYGGYSTRGTFNRKLFVEGFRGGMYYCRKYYGRLAAAAYRALLVIALPLAVAGLIISSLVKRSGEFLEKLMAYLEITWIAIAGPLEYPWSVDGK